MLAEARVSTPVLHHRCDVRSPVPMPAAQSKATEDKDYVDGLRYEMRLWLQMLLDAIRHIRSSDLKVGAS